jgi:uncharacterized damage-inducible protein DinB
MTVTQTEIDFKPGDFKPRTAGSRAEILAIFDESVAAFRKVLAEVTDGELMMTWTMKNDGKPVFSAPRVSVLRSFVMNHMIHHRGQLSVYLRENDVPLPSIYGQSADEQG